MPTLTALTATDARFPTSMDLDGSDAMNRDPDYSAAYVTLETGTDLTGDGLVFTIGRGNDVVVAALHALTDHVVGRDIGSLDDVNRLYRDLIGDSQLRWLGPEKGVMHMAIGAVVDAAWDLLARVEGKPLWQLIGELSPEQLVSAIDFRYLTDAITPTEALALLTARAEGKVERIAALRADGFPAYTTTPGWLGYSDEKMVRLTRQVIAEGFDMIKLKVGESLEDDLRRMALARETAGPDVAIATDANQRWDVAAAIEWMSALAPYGPAWIEEPTSPDDVLGHQAIRSGLRAAGHAIPVATGEQCQNKVIAKQLMQAGAIDVLQLDATRMGGINELLAVLLLAARFDVPVCPHAGGVGLCELVQHLAMADFVAFAGTTEGRLLEYVDHLHEHFVDPVQIVDGAYAAPTAPGSGARMLPATLAAYRYPDGRRWRAIREQERQGTEPHAQGVASAGASEKENG